jgi:hypothetical protein
MCSQKAEEQSGSDLEGCHNAGMLTEDGALRWQIISVVAVTVPGVAWSQVGTSFPVAPDFS